MSEEILKGPSLTRELEIADMRVRKENGQTRLSFSGTSTYRVERFFGAEVLDHSPGAVRLERAKRGAVPLLFNHNMDDPVGMVDSVRVENDRTIVDSHLFDTDRAREVERMVEGGLRNVSTRYRVHRVHEEPKTNTSHVREWEPLEYSIVTIPADPTVGVGRCAEGGEIFEVRMVRADPPTAKPAATTGATPVADESAAAGASADTQTRGHETRIEIGRQALDDNFAAKNEERRQTAIRNLATTNGIGDDTVEAWISRGSTLDQVADDMLKIFETRGKNQPKSVSMLGLSERDTGNYSLCRAIVAARDGDWKNAGFELECHRTISEKANKPEEKGHFYVPLEVQRRAMPVDMRALAERHNLGYMQQRDLNAALLGAGGALVQTSVMGFDEILRNVSFALRMGATRITGLRDNITIPRQSASATAEWLTSETDAPAESQQAFVQLAMSPKTVGAYTELSRKLLLQATADVEGLVNADLGAVCALATDVAVISGSGAVGQPLGIDNVPGVGAVNGAALALAGVLECQTDLATSNVMPMRGGYVTTPTVSALMITRVKYANTASPLWEGNVWTGTVQGFPAMSTNQVAAATMYFGDWAKCVIGEWGVLEIDTNPYASFAAGIIGVRALYSVDVGIRYPAAFTIATGIN